MAPKLKKSDQTKHKILMSARKYFTFRSYDQVGLREIAGGAGVDVALINRYFGSKKELYQAVIDVVFKPASTNQTQTTSASRFDNQDIGVMFAQHMLKMQDNPIYAERNNMFMQAISNDITAEIIAPQFYDCFVKQIESAIKDPDAKMKAELITSLIIGGSSIFTLFKRKISIDYDKDAFIISFAKMINSIL